MPPFPPLPLPTITTPYPRPLPLPPQVAAIVADCPDLLRAFFDSSSPSTSLTQVSDGCLPHMCGVCSPGPPQCSRAGEREGCPSHTCGVPPLPSYTRAAFRSCPHTTHEGMAGSAKFRVQSPPPSRTHTTPPSPSVRVHTLTLPFASSVQRIRGWFAHTSMAGLQRFK